MHKMFENYKYASNALSAKFKTWYFVAWMMLLLLLLLLLMLAIILRLLSLILSLSDDSSSRSGIIIMYKWKMCIIRNTNLTDMCLMGERKKERNAFINVIAYILLCRCGAFNLLVGLCLLIGMCIWHELVSIRIAMRLDKVNAFALLKFYGFVCH